MLNIYKLSTAIIISALAPVALASHTTHPYLGIEIIQTNQNYKAHHGKKVFKKNLQNYNVFGGFSFTKYVGAELGYELQAKRRKTVATGTASTIPAGDDIFDNRSYAANITSNNSIKGSHPYLGIFGEYRANFASFGHMRFQGMLGASISHIKFKQFVISQNGTAPADYAAGSTITGSKTKLVPMVKLTAQYDCNKNIGFRASVNYRYLRSIKIKIDQDPTGNREVRLKDTFGIGLGIVYSFA